MKKSAHLVLSSDIPDSEAHVLVLHRFHVESCFHAPIRMRRYDCFITSLFLEAILNKVSDVEIELSFSFLRPRMLPALYGIQKLRKHSCSLPPENDLLVFL